MSIEISKEQMETPERTLLIKLSREILFILLCGSWKKLKREIAWTQIVDGEIIRESPTRKVFSLKQ